MRFIQKRVWFKDKLGKKVCSVLTLPFFEKNQPCVILLHGLGTSKESNTYVSMAKLLCENNIASLRIDMYAHGESQGKFIDMNISTCIESVKASLDYLKNLNFIDKKRIGILGSSLGGSIALKSLSNFKLKCGVLFCPVSDFSEIFKQKYYGTSLVDWKQKGFLIRVFAKKKYKLGYNYYKEGIKFKGYEIAKKIKSPILIVHGDKDINVSVQQSKKLINLIPKSVNKKLVVIKGADHYFKVKKYRSLRHNEAITWFLKYL